MTKLSIIFTFLSLALSSISIVTYAAECGPIPGENPLYSGSEIELEKDIKVNGNTVGDGKYKPQAAIATDGSVNTNVNLTFPELNPTSFPSNTTSADIKSNISFTVNSSVETFYDELTLEKENTSMTFTGGGPFHIDKLETKKGKATINFSAGIYYINELKLKKEDTTINIISEPVIIHIGEKFEIEKEDTNINKNGNVDGFIIYLHSNAKFEAKDSDLDFTGIIYGPDVDEVKFTKEDVNFHGAIIVSGDKIKIEKEGFSLTYTAEDQAAVNAISTCNITAPKLLAQYHMDEISWNGTTGEVGDTSGNNNHGTAVNGLSTQQLDSAITGDPGTCGTGQFDGLDDYIVLPSIDNLTGSFTFSAWVKSTKNTQGRLFADDDNNQGYSLSLNEPSSGKLQFYSRAVIPISLDTASVVVPRDDNWYFVTAVHDAATKQRLIYVDGELEASDIYTGTWGEDAGDVSIGSETNASNEGVGFAAFEGNIDEVQIFDGALTQTQIQDIMDDTHPCDVPAPASNFNCVATGSSPITGRLYTKLTNQDFTLDVAALQDATTLASTFANTVTVELVDASSGSCATHPVLFPEITQSLNFASSSGVKTSAVINSDRAYRNLKCRVTDNTYASPTVGCSTDAFSIRPPSLSISSSLTNASNSGSPTAKSGANFNITATTNTLNYDGIPAIVPARVEPHVGAIRTGEIAGTFPAANITTGNSIGTTFTYSEVGNIRFLDNGVVDSSFAAIDQFAGDCLNNSSNTENGDGKIGCNIANLSTSDYIGRFVPDHFEIAINSQGSFGGAAYECTNFNYVGQDFTYDSRPEIKVTAYNALSPQSITQNYTGNYAKLSMSDFTITSPTTDANQLGSDALNKVNLTWTDAAADLVDNGNGSHTYTFGDDDITYLQQTNSLVAPFTNAVAFEFTDITDSDNVTSTNLPQSVTPSGASIRFGRLNIKNAHGSELAPLTLPVITEYFNGSNWSLNSVDSCTSLALTSNILLSNPASGNNRPGDTAMIIESSSSTASLLNTLFSSGEGNISFSAPGEDNQGYIDVKGELTGFEWLQFDWNSDGGFSENPSGRASFGLYNGSNRLIFRREVY